MSDHHLSALPRMRAGSTPVDCVLVTTRWAVCPTDGKAHSLLPGNHSPVVQARCGHSLPVGVVAHDHLPGWQWCVPCMVAHLVPAPVFARKNPGWPPVSHAPESAPGGQPVPASALRWVRCPVDQHLRLLPPDEAEAAGIKGHGRAECGRLIPRPGLTIDQPPAGFCVTFVAVGTGSRDAS